MIGKLASKLVRKVARYILGFGEFRWDEDSVYNCCCFEGGSMCRVTKV